MDSHPYGTYGYSSGQDLVYPTYDSTDMGVAELSTTPPTASFAGTGLPFRALDFIRNYNTGGYTMGEQDSSLWQSYDPGVFEYNPDIPFTLGDSEILQDTHH
jgi:hypothetical protein